MKTKIKIRNLKELRKQKRIGAGVYRIFLDEILIYIGTSENLYKRLNQYFLKNDSGRHQGFLKRLIRKNVSGISIECFLIKQRKERINHEVYAIIREKPILNGRCCESLKVKS